MAKKIEINEELFQDLTKFYIETFSLSPLAAKIYAYLRFDFENRGICFDELVNVFQASKSSVSSSLNILLSNNFIKDINRIDERRRYFVMNQDYVKIRFEGIVKRLRKEIEIIDKLSEYREDQNAALDNRIKIYRSLLNENITTIENTLNKF